MTEIEYVGHIISGEEIKFFDAAKSKTLDFPIPTTTGQSKQFVGMAEYFHSHVRNFSDIARSLQALLHGYTKKNAHAKAKYVRPGHKGIRHSKPYKLR